jgi:hypothetical protein
MAETQYAFRCKVCGRLHEAGHAGDNELPHACQVCGAGVVFRHAELAEELKKPGLTPERIVAIANEIGKCDPASKRLVPENWEVLADATPQRLQELGLTPEVVAQHVPAVTKESAKKPQAITVQAVERLTTQDK